MRFSSRIGFLCVTLQGTKTNANEVITFYY